MAKKKTSKKFPKDNHPDKVKHLEFIQAVITRMNTNSFQIKGWTTAIVAAIAAIAIKESTNAYFIIALLVAMCFWALDGFYLYQERLYRKLYEEVRLEDYPRNFDMNASVFHGGRARWRCSTFSKTMRLFYIPIIGILLAFLLANACFHLWK